MPAAVGEVNVGEGRALVDGVEGKEVNLLDAVPGLLGITEHADHGGIDGVLVLHPGGPSGEQDDIVLLNAHGKDLDKAAVDAECNDPTRVTAKIYSAR